MTRKFCTLLLAVLAQLACLRAQQTYHQLEIIPNQSGTAGELRFVETTGWTAGTGTNYVGFKAPASIATNFVYELPNTLPGATSCLVVTTAGVIQYDAGCAGGTSLPVIDTTSIVEGSADPTKELRFEVDGFTTSTVRVLTPQNADYTIAGLETSQTFSGLNVFTDTVTVSKAATVSQLLVRSEATNSVALFRGEAYMGAGALGGTQFQGAAVGGTAGTPSATPANSVMSSLQALGYTTSFGQQGGRIDMFAGSLWSGTNSETRMNFRVTPASSLTQWTAMTIGDAGESVTVKGRSGQTQDVFRVEDSAGSQQFRILGESSGTSGFVVAKTIVANTPGGDDLGSTGNLWDDIYAERIHLGTASSLSGEINLFNSGDSDARTIGTAAASGLNFAGITVNTSIIPAVDAFRALGDSVRSWLQVFAYEYCNEFGTCGADLALSCGAGDAIKTLSVSGGIVTGATCGPP